MASKPTHLHRRMFAAVAIAVAFVGCTGVEALEDWAADGSPRVPAILLTVTGDAKFDDRLTERTLCRAVKSATSGGAVGIVKGVSATSADSVVILFSHVRRGTRDLVNRGHHFREPTLSIMAGLGGRIYQWGLGSKATVTIRDRAGRSGTIAATGFSAFENSQDVPANVSVKVSWKCD